MDVVENLTAQTIGKYHLGRYLGHTGVAHVYQAQHPDTGELVTVNLLPSHFAGDPSFAEHFMVEAGMLATLEHPNIVPIYDSGVEDGYPFLVMKNVEGPTLKDLVDSTNQRFLRVPMDVSVFIINSLGGALSYAHKQIIPHTDVKPTNVLLEKSGIVMLTDFGLGTLLNYKTISAMEKLKGFFSSEKFQEKNEAMRGDVFSLGMIFYLLATGKLPYAEDVTGSLDPDILSAPLVSPKSLVPEIEEEINQVILKSISRNPDLRYPSIDEYLEALANYSRNVKTTVLPSARLSDVASFSSRYSSVPPPDSYDGVGEKKVSLYFLDTGQILDLETQKEYTIGRQYENQPILPDIDLTPFKGFEWGISRLHAKINVGYQEVTITDMGSSNGTWHAGKRIPEDSPYVLNHGDLIMLGKLRIQALISD